jgi:hypothetical protein
MKLKYTVFFIVLFLSKLMNGQGCSDAGFCTINSFKPANGDSSVVLKNKAKLGAFYGLADNAITVYGSYLEYSRQFNKRFGMDLKLTSLAQSGNNIQVAGLSDVFLNSSFELTEKLKITSGIKLPLSNSGRNRNNLPLPMDYQSSLGTVDLIFGIGYEIKKIHIIAAIQQPISQNSNQFIASHYPMESELRSFQSTRNFQRSGDVLIRISYPFSLSQKIKITPSLLPIYHLLNDRFTDEFNTVKEIKGSQGLTLNGNLYFDFQLNEKNGFQLNAGMPFIVRPARPDGLTRSFIANIEYQYRF